MTKRRVGTSSREARCAGHAVRRVSFGFRIERRRSFPKKLAVCVAAAVTPCCFSSAPALAQSDWPVSGHDPGAQRFSPLKQINAKNVTKLQRAWTFHTGDAKDDTASEGAPLVIDGVLYFDAGKNVFALDPVSGQQIWKFETKGTRPRGLVLLAGRPKHARRG